jgi:glycolate oxidase
MDHSGTFFDLIADLVDVVTLDRVVVDGDVLRSYSQDRALFPAVGVPAALVMPETTQEVSACITVAAQRGVPIVTRGAGSGLAGGANAVDGCVVLSLSRMNRILDIDRIERTARVQPGVLNGALKSAVSEHGLWYPPDPASYEFCSIGGNVATNAGGLCCVRHGVTRDYVIGLQVALPSGEVVRTGRMTQKKTTGLDLTGLFVGSEGILGVITEVTVRLVPPPPPMATAVAYFSDVESAGAAIVDVFRQGLQPSMMEYIDRRCLQQVEAVYKMELDTSSACLLLIQVDADQRGRSIEAVATACRMSGATEVLSVTDGEEGDMFVEVRRRVWPAFERLGLTMLPEDIAVPRHRISDRLLAIARVEQEHQFTVPVVGHAGDGNLHPILVFDPNDQAARARAEAAFDDIIEAALALGGTAAGEHGIGVLKLAYVDRELDPVDAMLQRRLRRFFDPAGTLNPGRAL